MTRFRVSLVPIRMQGEVLLFTAIGIRERTGVMERLGIKTMALVPDEGGFEMRVLSGPQDVADVFARDAGPVPKGINGSYVMRRLTDEALTAVLRGEAPPVAFNGAIGGTLTVAPSREAQCRLLDDWIQPYAAEVDINRISVDAVLKSPTKAFADEVFNPVFGLPYLLTSQQERLELARFIHETCSRGQGMRLLGLVGDHALRSENGFANMASVIANRADTDGWRTIAEEKIAQLSQGGPDGLGALAQIDAELRQRTPEMSVATADALAGRIKAAVARLTVDDMIAEIAAVPGSFDENGVGIVIQVAQRAITSDLPDEHRRPDQSR